MPQRNHTSHLRVRPNKLSHIQLEPLALERATFKIDRVPSGDAEFRFDHSAMYPMELLSTLGLSLALSRLARLQ